MRPISLPQPGTASDHDRTSTLQTSDHSYPKCDVPFEQRHDTRQGESGNSDVIGVAARCHRGGQAGMRDGATDLRAETFTRQAVEEFEHDPGVEPRFSHQIPRHVELCCNGCLDLWRRAPRAIDAMLHNCTVTHMKI